MQTAADYVFVRSLNEPQFTSRSLANSAPLTYDTIDSFSTSNVTSNLKRFFFIVNVLAQPTPAAWCQPVPAN